MMIGKIIALKVLNIAKIAFQVLMTLTWIAVCALIIATLISAIWNFPYVISIGCNCGH